jgi:hypothetical protein
MRKILPKKDLSFLVHIRYLHTIKIDGVKVARRFRTSEREKRGSPRAIPS